MIEYKPLVDKALELAIHQPAHVMGLATPAGARAPAPGLREPGLAGLPRRRPSRPIRCRWPAAIRYQRHHVHLEATGKPKGIVRDNGGHAVAVRYAVRTIYGMQVGDVWSRSPTSAG
ncbi:hypothetical protein P4238_02025 [Pseudomonas aeruginosa]|nr:hypothetical protein [Pseudomonas aeruginosa]